MRDAIIFSGMILCIIGTVFLVAYGTITVQESFIRHTTVKVAKVTSWKEPITGWHKTSVISYDGSELIFWGDLSDVLEAEGVYELTYRRKYRMILFIGNKLLSCEQELKSQAVEEVFAFEN